MPKGSYGHIKFDKHGNAFKFFMKRRDDIYGSLAIKEIDFMKRCDHPNIVKIKDIILSKNSNEHDKICIVMEKADCTLYEYYKKRHREKNHFTNVELRNLIYQMISSLYYIHSLYICHKDIKPNNFLMYGDIVKLSDFGLASNMVSDRTECYIERYRAPEVLRGKEYDSRVDIWALGCIIYEMITGNALFAGNTSTDIFESIINRVGISSDAIKYLSVKKNPARWNLDLSKYPLIEDLLKGMLDTNPRTRFTAIECLELDYFKGLGKGYFRHRFYQDQDGIKIFIPHVIKTFIPYEFSILMIEKYYDKFNDKEIYIALDMLKRIQAEKKYEREEEIFQICLYISHKIMNPIHSIKKFQDLFPGTKISEEFYFNQEINILEFLDYKIYHWTLYDSIPKEEYKRHICVSILQALKFENDYEELVRCYHEAYDGTSEEEKQKLT